MAVSDYVQRFLAGQGMGGTPMDSDSQDVVRRFLRARGRLRDDVDAADTAEVQRRLAAQAMAPSGLDESVLEVPVPRSQKTSPAAAAPTATDADYNARRAAASRTALVNDVLSGATEGFDRATEWIAGPGPGVRARDRNAVANAEAAFAKSEEERRLLAQRAADKPLADARKAAELEKLKADTAKAKAATITAEGDAAYEAALRDINSPETQAFRDQAVAISGGKLTPEHAARLNGLQLREAVKTATSQLNAEAMAGIQRERLTQTATDAEAARDIRMRELNVQIAAIEARRKESQLDRDQEERLFNLKAELEREKIAAEAANRAANKEAKASDVEYKSEGELRKELQNNPVIKEYQGAVVGYDKVRRAAADASAAGDIALIFGYMKTIDPTSTVREGEFATASNAGGLDDRLVNMYNKVLSGQRLTRQQREQFIQSAKTQHDAYQAKAKAIIDSYRRTAERNGLNPANVVLEGMYGDEVAPRVGTAANPARSVTVNPTPSIDDLPDGRASAPAETESPPPRRAPRKSVAPPAAEIPRLISLKKPDGTRKTREEVKAEIAEGETARLPMGKGADGEMRYRTVKKVNGKVEVVEEDE